MARSKSGQAIRESQRTAQKPVQLDEFIQEARAQSDLATWRRGRAVLGSIQGKPVAELTKELPLARRGGQAVLPLRAAQTCPLVPDSRLLMPISGLL